MVSSFCLVFLAFGCSLAADVCYAPCGCWDDDFPFDTRPLPDLPGSGNKVTFTLFTSEEPDVGIDLTWDHIPEELNTKRKTIFFIHGWNNNGRYSYATKDLLYKANHDVNFIAVDWSEGASTILYPLAASNTRLVGACASYLASQLVAKGASWDQIHCMGASLGAQGCGYMGQASNGSLGRATGLDPAGPWFNIDDPRVHLDQSDAQFVDIIHTNAGYQGTLLRPGHVDIYVNNGEGPQPGCTDIGCDHERANRVNQASIEAADACQFKVRPCQNQEDAEAGLCEECGETGCNRLGYHATPEPPGRFYVKTTANYPYCID